MAAPLLGHLDPEFLLVLADIQRLLRDVFQTKNDLTLAISGTGTAAMEAALSNLIEPGDPILACIQGYFGERLAEMAGRYGAQVTRLECPGAKCRSIGHRCTASPLPGQARHPGPR
jgi:alanine-glyoxylate transaminase/serine-glyoxylate transaminase/serine-pyruvate transaminase